MGIIKKITKSMFNLFLAILIGIVIVAIVTTLPDQMRDPDQKVEGEVIKIQETVTETSETQNE